MRPLSIGDHVSDLDGSHDGRLVDIDGSTAYVMQANGVEIEFPLNQLKLYETPPVAVKRTLSGPLRDTTLSPAHKALLASVPAEIIAAIAKSYDTSGPVSSSSSAYAALPDSKKLEIIRIYLPSLPQRLLAPHMGLVVAMRDLARQGR